MVEMIKEQKLPEMSKVVVIRETFPEPHSLVGKLSIFGHTIGNNCILLWLNLLIWMVFASWCHFRLSFRRSCPWKAHKAEHRCFYYPFKFFVTISNVSLSDKIVTAGVHILINCCQLSPTLVNDIPNHFGLIDIGCTSWLLVELWKDLLSCKNNFRGTQAQNASLQKSIPCPSGFDSLILFTFYVDWVYCVNCCSNFSV